MPAALWVSPLGAVAGLQAGRREGSLCLPSPRVTCRDHCLSCQMFLGSRRGVAAPSPVASPGLIFLQPLWQLRLDRMLFCFQNLVVFVSGSVLLVRNGLCHKNSHYHSFSGGSEGK